MSNKSLPQLTSSRCFLTEGGIETTLAFDKGLDLPEFSTFPLLDKPAESQIIEDCFIEYVKIASRRGTGIVLESPTWRASLPWIRKLGYPDSAVEDGSRQGIAMLKRIRDKYQTSETPIVISGCLGPLSDAYNPDPSKPRLSETIESYRSQVVSLAEAGADMIGIITVTQTEEAVATVMLARESGLPVWVSLTLETDGKLVDGRTIAEFIKSVDEPTDGYAAYFGVNCAHPKHFLGILSNLPGEDRWVLERLGEIRSNASDKSHDELDNCTELDRGDPAALGRLHSEFLRLLPNLKVVGGCCGTDTEHVDAMANAILGPRGNIVN